MGISPKLVLLIYKSYWKFIKDSIHGLELEEMTEKDFGKTPTNFNITYIGKLYTNIEKVQKYKRKLKYLEENDKIKKY